MTIIFTGNVTELWNESTNGSTYGYLVPDLDGDGLNDTLVNIYEYDPSTGTSTSTLIAKKGIDGTHLWQESVSAGAGSYASIYGYSAGDLNGDERSDVLVNIYEYDTKGTISTLIAKKGIDGTHLWQESVSIGAGGYASIYGYSAGDLNGDKLNDVLVNIYEYDPSTGTNTNTLIAKKGIDGTHLWEATSDTWIWIAYVWAGNNVTVDLNGDGISDVLLGTYNKVYAVTTT